MRALTAYRGVLAVREARALIGASAASQIGDWLYNAALLGYVFSATGSAAWVGVATIGRLLPYVFLGPFGGAIADRYPRRTVLLVGDLLRLLLMLVLAAVVAGDGPVALVIALAALSSAAGSAEQPAALALLPRLVGERRLGPANALLHTVQDLGVVVGPALGAVVFAVSSASMAFVVNAGTFAVSALLIATLPRQRSRIAKDRAGAPGVLAGVRTARVTPFVVPLFLLVAMVEFTYGAQTVQLVVYAEESLGLGAGGYGLLLAGSGVGGLISAVVNAQLVTARRLTLVVVGTGALACGSQLVFGGTTWLALALVAAVVGGAALVSCEVIAETVLARVVPSETLGRVAGLFNASGIAAMVGGAVLASVLVGTTSVEGSFWILGGAALTVAVACSLGLRGLDEASHRRTEELASRLGIVEQLPITAAAPQLVLERLASASRLASYTPGTDVVVQGEPADVLYAIVTGRVVVHRDGIVRVHLGPGDSFGERGLLDNAPRNATVTTEMETVLLSIDGDVLLDSLEAAPALTPALNRSSSAPGVIVSPEDPKLIDDSRWVERSPSQR